MTRPLRSVLLGLGLLALSACGSGGGGSSDDRSVSFESGTLRAAGEALVLLVPEGVTLSDQLGEYVYWATVSEPACQDPTDNTVDFLVAQACLAFHNLYLEPERLPSNLSVLREETVDSYIEAIKNASPDPAHEFSGYYSAEEFQQFQEPALTGERALIGMRLSIREGESVPVVEEVLPYSRAWWDGIRPGDRLLAATLDNGQRISFDGMPLEDVLDALPHTEEEAVTLTVEREGEILEVPTASETHIERLLDGAVAYLGVRRFTLETGPAVAEDYNELLNGSRGLSGVVVDLRANSGGSLYGAVQLADFLAGEGRGGDPMMKLRDVYGLESVFRFGDEWPPTDFAQDFVAHLDPDLPVAVLVDSGSASAAEIVAAVLRYAAGATLVGETTYGKGVSQEVVELADGSAVLIPSRWVFVFDGTSWISWHITGLPPDQTEGTPEGGAAPDNDPQLEAALRSLAGGAAARRVAVFAPRSGPVQRTAPHNLFR